MKLSNSGTLDNIRLSYSFIFIVLALVFTLSACDQESDNNKVSVSGSTLSAPIPKALLAINKDNLVVSVLHNLPSTPGTFAPDIVVETVCDNLVVDALNGTYSCNISFPQSNYTISILFSIIDETKGLVPVAQTSIMQVTVFNGLTSTADFGASTITYFDNDNNGIRDLDELDDDSNSTIPDTKTIVATTAADFSSGAHAVISEDENGVLESLNNLQPTASDITVAAFGSHFYRIEREFAGNNITKFSKEGPQVPIWQYSTNDTGSAVLSDPHDMVFASETKAYVLRYGTNTMWIVDPSATTEEDFKIGEIDLSAYADADGVPEMDNGVIVNGRLYITLQRLETFAVTQTAYIAIFDVDTDMEVDANIDGDSLKGIPLLTKNPTNVVAELASNTIYIQGSGSFFPVEYSGGIEKIDLSSLSTSIVLDDGDDADHPYGLITELAVISDSVLYFVGYVDFDDNTLYKLDLSTGDIEVTMVTSLISAQIAHLAADSNAQLWVSDSANATVRIIDTETDTEVDALSTFLQPGKIVFVNQ